MTLDLTSPGGLGATGARLVGKTLGTAYDHYRAAGNGSTPPLDAGNRLGSVPVWLTVDPKLKATKAPVTPKPIWYAGLDPSVVVPGDYLVGALGTFFLSTSTLPAPISVIFCNTLATVERPQTAAPGPDFRGGVKASPLVVATQWPAFIALQTRRNQNELQLPGEVRSQNATLFLPSTLPGAILAGDTVHEHDKINARYTVQGASLTPGGWQATLIQATA